MASNNKQKEKLVNDYDFQLKKIEAALHSLKDSVKSLQDGDESHPYWNGSNAYNTIKSILAYIDNDIALVNYLYECKKSIK